MRRTYVCIDKMLEGLADSSDLSSVTWMVLMWDFTLFAIGHARECRSCIFPYQVKIMNISVPECFVM